MASPTVAANAYASLGRMLESGGGIGAGAGKASDLGGGQSFGAVLRMRSAACWMRAKSDAQSIAMASGKSQCDGRGDGGGGADVAVSTLVSVRIG